MKGIPVEDMMYHQRQLAAKNVNNIANFKSLVFINFFQSGNKRSKKEESSSDSSDSDDDTPAMNPMVTRSVLEHICMIYFSDVDANDGSNESKHDADDAEHG